MNKQCSIVNRSLKQRGGGNRQLLGRSRGALGFTLLELVAVLVILSLAAGLVTVQYAAPLRKAQLDRAVSQVRDIDLFARRLSRNEQVRMQLTDDAKGPAIDIFLSGEDRFRRYEFPSSLEILFQDHSGNPMDFVVFSPLDATLDYRVVVQNGRSRRLVDFAGGSGHARLR